MEILVGYYWVFLWIAPRGDDVNDDKEELRHTCFIPAMLTGLVIVSVFGVQGVSRLSGFLGKPSSEGDPHDGIVDREMNAPFLTMNVQRKRYFWPISRCMAPDS